MKKILLTLSVTLFLSSGELLAQNQNGCTPSHQNPKKCDPQEAPLDSPVLWLAGASVLFAVASLSKQHQNSLE